MPVVSSAKKYYVVWKGRQSGVFSTWQECSAQVSGYPDAEYKSFPSLHAAEAALRGSYEDYKGQHISPLTAAELQRIGKPIAASYCVDAACSGSPGPVEYRCVHTSTHRVLFRQGPFADGSNNVGEFLAIVHALGLLQQKDIHLPIYSDSETALGWVRAKKCNTKLRPTAQNASLFDLIQRAETWLVTHSYDNPLLKWETGAWGEIPADYGRK